MQFSLVFKNAVEDYSYFLQKEYPQKGSLKLVGDRHKLNRSERSMLYRGISMETENNSRSKKLVQAERLSEKVLLVDGLNQILTIASYLNGNIVYISSDGLLRDASEIHGKAFRTELLSKSVELIDKYCKTLNLKQLVFYLDQQVNKLEKIRNLLVKKIPASQIIISDQVDKALVNSKSGIIATSDSQVIDKSKLKVFDFSFHTLKFHFNPNFPDLYSLIYKKS